MLVKIPKCSKLISVGSCLLICMLAMYVSTVCNCVLVRNAVEILRGFRSVIKYKSCCYVGALNTKIGCCVYLVGVKEGIDCRNARCGKLLNYYVCFVEGLVRLLTMWLAPLDILLTLPFVNDPKLTDGTGESSLKTHQSRVIKFIIICDRLQDEYRKV